MLEDTPLVLLDRNNDFSIRLEVENIISKTQLIDILGLFQQHTSTWTVDERKMVNRNYLTKIDCREIFAFFVMKGINPLNVKLCANIACTDAVYYSISKKVAPLGKILQLHSYTTDREVFLETLLSEYYQKVNALKQ